MSSIPLILRPECLVFTTKAMIRLWFTTPQQLRVMSDISISTSIFISSETQFPYVPGMFVSDTQFDVLTRPVGPGEVGTH